MDLSFVVIGLNEERNITRTITSIYNLNLSPLSFEVLYIDSGSKDNTLTLVKQFPLVDLYILDSNKYSAALSRFVGSNIAKGKYIFFIDGDMEISQDSDVVFCIEQLQRNNIGIISGKLPEFWYRNNRKIKEIKDRYGVIKEMENLVSPGGFFIISKELLNKVGNFNINLKCNEEIELFSRIKNRKNKLLRTNKLICVHHYHLDENSKSFNKRLKEGFFTDFWRALVHTFRNRSIKNYLSFPGKKKDLIVLGLNLMMYMLILFSFLNFKILLIPLSYYLLILTKRKFDYKNFIFNQKYNLYLILGLFYYIVSFKEKKVIYNIKKI